MNNFRHSHPKSFGIHGSDLPNPWMTEEELMNMRRQNSHYNPVMQNMSSNMHSPSLNQGPLPIPNKNFVNQSSCKMPTSNFTNIPNPDIFRSPNVINESYQNRFMGNRFPNNAYSPMNIQHKMNQGNSLKDIMSSPSNLMSSQSFKNDGFSESISKPLFSNMRQPQERFSCMQDDQAQFSSKYDNSRAYQEKGFPFSNEKNFRPQNHAALTDNIPVAPNFSYKPNYKAPSLFPAYSPNKDAQDEGTKVIQQSAYGSDFIAKSNASCDKPLPASFVGKSNNFSDKPLAPSVSFSKTMEPFQEKLEPFQSKTETFQDKVESLQRRTELFQDRHDRVVNELFPPQSTASSFVYDKPSLKTMPNSQVTPPFKTTEDSSAITNSKYTYSSENQQPCYPSSSEIIIQRSQGTERPIYTNALSSKDCLMQNVPFSTQSDVAQQNVKESYSSYNFESNISTTDIADLLPGLDAFLKEHLGKTEEVAPKNDVNKPSGPNCVFSDDEWSKHSIPFIGDNQTPNVNNMLNDNKDSVCDQSTFAKDKCSDQLELKPEDATDMQLPVQPITSKAGENETKTTTIPTEKEAPEVPTCPSTLEEAIDIIVTNDAIVGLDYIIEYKKNITQNGSFPFYCKLCNSAINRASIIDHIIGSKHRLRYLKSKDESKYEYIISLKVEKTEKDSKIAETAFEMEKIHGRGRVTINTEDFQKDIIPDIASKELEEEPTVEPVFTLDKIPIGFEALSPEHEEINADFSLGSNLNHLDHDSSNIKKDTANLSAATEVKQDVPSNVSSSPISKLPGLGSSPFHSTRSDSDSLLPLTDCNNEVPKVSNFSNESLKKVTQQYSSTAPCTSVKRSLSNEDESQAKHRKSGCNEDLKPSIDMTDQQQDDVKTAHSSTEIENFDLNILEKLSKSTISSDEEASVVVQVINVLMELLLRYKLQHLSLDKVEKLMKSLQTKSPESVEDLSSLLKDCNVAEKKNIQDSSTLIEDTADNLRLKSNVLPEENTGSHIKQEPPNLSENNKMNVDEFISADKKILDNCITDSALSTKVFQPVSDVGTNNVSFPATQSSGLVTLDNTAEIPRSVVNTSCMSQASVPQVSNSVDLKPPPFFSWPQTSEAMTNQVSYATVQGSQTMMWTSPYQHTQTQFTQMPYYQPQSYGNTYGGNQAFQAQFSVLSQSSMPVKMSIPPLPPPPPPPPPAPSNPPLPPLPTSAMYPCAAGSQSVPVPSNAPACLHMYSKQPPPPPPLP